MGLKREATCTQSRPNDPDSGTGRLQRRSVSALTWGGSHTTSWGGAQSGGSFLHNAFMCMHLGVRLVNLTSWRDQHLTGAGEVHTELTSQPDPEPGKVVESQSACLARSACPCPCAYGKIQNKTCCSDAQAVKTWWRLPSHRAARLWRLPETLHWLLHSTRAVENSVKI